MPLGANALFVISMSLVLAMCVNFTFSVINQNPSIFMKSTIAEAD
jgi:hypothetical protein